AHEVDGRGIELGRAGDSGKHGIAAVAAAINRDAVAICDALLDEPLHAVGDVVLHGQAPLPETGFPEAAAVSGGTAKVHLQYAVAPIRKKLRLGIEPPPVARPRPAMWVDD